MRRFETYYGAADGGMTFAVWSDVPLTFSLAIEIAERETKQTDWIADTARIFGYGRFKYFARLKRDCENER